MKLPKPISEYFVTKVILNCSSTRMFNRMIAPHPPEQLTILMQDSLVDCYSQSDCNGDNLGRMGSAKCCTEGRSYKKNGKNSCTNCELTIQIPLSSPRK
jgi:hypothetical protein